MRAVAGLIALLLLAPGPWALGKRQVKLALFVGGKEVGTGLYTQELAADKLSIEFAFSFAIGQIKSSAKITSVYDQSGRPREMISWQGGAQTRRRRELYRVDSVRVEEKVQGKTQAKSIAIPQDKPLASPSLYWLIKGRPPAPDTVDEHWTLSSETNNWELARVRYKGIEEITINGRKVRAHKVQEHSGTFWFDDRGLPYRILLPRPGFVFERQ